MINPEHEMKRLAPNVPKRNYDKYSYLHFNTAGAVAMIKMGKALRRATKLNWFCPFVDEDIIDFSYSLPDTLKIARNEEKPVLRGIIAKNLNSELIYKKKSGFSTPWKKMMINNDEFIRMGLDLITDPKCKQRNIYKKNAYDKFLRETSKTFDENSIVTFYRMVSLEIWCRIFLDKSSQV